MSKYGRFWEMREGGPYDGPDGGTEVFKCTKCGAVTRPQTGFNGEPSVARCSHGCRLDNDTDWVNGKQTNAFRRNFDRVFPNAPGSGL